MQNKDLYHNFIEMFINIEDEEDIFKIYQKLKKQLEVQEDFKQQEKYILEMLKAVKNLIDAEIKIKPKYKELAKYTCFIEGLRYYKSELMKRNNNNFSKY